MKASPLLLVLGAGYVGREILARHPDAIGTHRPGKNLTPRELAFSLAEPATWAHLPVEGRHVVWTFPAAPLEQVQAFYQSRLRHAASIIVLGSTSAYVNTTPDATVTEDTPVDLRQPRVIGEEWLLTQGATLLRLAGIFGPAREPLRWLEKGLIKNGLKRVNLIHLADIVHVIYALAQRPAPAMRLNASNGEALEWKELVAMYRERGLLPPTFLLPEFSPAMENKFVDSSRLRSLFPEKQWRTPNLDAS